MIARILCLVSLANAHYYNEADFNAIRTGAFAREAILTYTVILLWLRQMKILQITRSTGAFVYMLSRMFGDVLSWCVPPRTSNRSKQAAARPGLRAWRRHEHSGAFDPQCARAAPPPRLVRRRMTISSNCCYTSSTLMCAWPGAG